MSWNDIFFALDALLMLPILAAGIVLAWNAATSAESALRPGWLKKSLGSVSRIALGEIEAPASRHYK
ncbi:hypothetical protein HCU64_03190 [Methylobacterium sp. C25]|uniref:hypothetical protein n=1 Tax=Methylobacterium sp. C25 TaxID=2721622 RepID=UPI001F297618|nr:hypothetical protein [Methylobacterium sp. C25]MCE4222745.1 hypothetical protein [Methylobacterium sp. C25]